MKKNLLIAIAMLATQFIFSQASLNAIKSLPINYEDAEVKPEFPGGYNEFMKFIAKNFKTPEVEGLSGIVKISFVVETSGKISEIKILKDIGSGAAEEAVRVVSKSPNWSPGEQDGKPVRVTFQLPITIRGY
ncbi:MAG: energy transducer TonB [Flavobacterium sp.]|uniref:energy transducer TonB n=1 Tax=Flavobacterium sp. TaxID=239 RepID=UPI0032675460